MQERRRERAQTPIPLINRLQVTTTAVSAPALKSAETHPRKPRLPLGPISRKEPSAIKPSVAGYFLGINLPQAAPSTFSIALSVE